MKITTKKTLDNGVYRVSIWTGDWSENDVALMVAFGEPSINCGGDIVAGTPATVTGTSDLSEGHDWSSATQTITVQCPLAFSGTKSITLDTACLSLADVVDAITEALVIAGASPGIVVTADVTGDFVVISTALNGATSTMTLGGTALATLGIEAGSHTGTGLPTFHMPDDYHKIKTEVPFAAGFDYRDETTPSVAQAKADAWLVQIDALLKDAIDTLRAGSTNFDSEASETY